LALLGDRPGLTIYRAPLKPADTLGAMLQASSSGSNQTGPASNSYASPAHETTTPPCHHGRGRLHLASSSTTGVLTRPAGYYCILHYDFKDLSAQNFHTSSVG